MKEIKVTSCLNCPFQETEGRGWTVNVVCSFNVYISGNFEFSWDGYEESNPTFTFDNNCPLTTITISR